MHAHTHTLTDILHNAFAIFLKCILPPFYAFQQMSVFLGKEHTPSPGSLKKIVCHKFNRNFIDSVTQTSYYLLMISWLHKNGYSHTWIISFRGGTHIYVHPDFVLLAYISYGFQRVKRTLHCGSCCAADNKWRCTLETNLVNLCNP